MGGLGNQLFQFALGRSISKILKCKLYIDYSYYKYKNNKYPETFRLNNFKISKKIKFIKNIFKMNVRAIKTLYYFFGKKVKLNIAKNLLNRKVDYIFFEDFKKSPNEFIEKIEKNSIYIGHWENKHFFHKIKKDLFKNLKQRNINSKKINNFKKKIKNNSIAIHISDTRPWPNLYDELKNSYYLKAIKYFGKIYNNLDIHVFCINKNYAKKIMDEVAFSHNVTYVDKYNFSTMEEFYILRNYSNYILGRSTFGWWGSYLSFKKKTKITIPKYWFKNELTPNGRIVNQMKVI